MPQQKEKAYLLLCDGTLFEGYHFGVKGEAIGEVVFTTGMTGYQETLTDPSYFGQLVTQTFPTIGNYGANESDLESGRAWVSGYIVREWCELPSNFRSTKSINTFLTEQNVIGIYGIDTRRLTKILRECGVMNGLITTNDPRERLSELLDKINAYRIVNAVERVSVSKPEKYTASQGRYHVTLMDYGYKRNILRSLLDRGCDVTVMPAGTTAKQLAELNPDGIMLSNGPGDPADNVQIIKNLKEVIKLQIPIFGICLGHQLLALANGARTAKLKYGHRGANQPVTDLQRGITYITSQNHGYAVLGDTLDSAVGQVSHINANDKTCEGVRYQNAPAFTVQFHPEACGGPLDTAYLFDEFISMMKEGNR